MMTEYPIATKRRRKQFHRLDLRTLYEEFRTTPYFYTYNWHESHQRFNDWLVPTTTQPDLIATGVAWCTDCGFPDQHDDERINVHQQQVCRPCFANYRECSECDRRFRWLTFPISSEVGLCESCINHDHTYCDYCSGWYHDDDEDQHWHGQNCRCRPRTLEFTIPHHGSVLVNDERVEVKLPDDVISTEGLQLIRQYLQAEGDMMYGSETQRHYYALSHRVASDLGDEWQTREGNFSKRLGKLAYKEFALKIPPKVLAHVGNLARDHSKGAEFTVAVTRDLNQGPEEFAHEESCWWNEYYKGRCALKTNGGFALRSFDREYDGYGHPVDGRAWVLPVEADDTRNVLKPTLDARTPDGYILFNAYGVLEGFSAPRILAHLTGLSYAKIPFSATFMYVNSDSGYLIGSPEFIEKWKRHHNLNLKQHATLTEGALANA